MNARQAKISLADLASTVPDEAARPAAIWKAKKDLHVTGMSSADSATEAFDLSGEDGIAISDSSDEEDADGSQFQTMPHSKHSLLGVDSSPQKRKAMASSGVCPSPAASSSTPYRATPKGDGGNVFGTVQYGTRQLSQTHRALRSREAVARRQSKRSASRIPPTKRMSKITLPATAEHSA